MKKRTAISFIVILIFTLTVIMYFGNIFGKKPFRRMDSNNVLSASVSAYPPNITTGIEKEEDRRRLVDILKTVVIYQKDASGRNCAGQLVKFNLSMKDGSTLEVGAYNPFIFLDGVCYKTKYGPCEELNALGNKLIHND